MTETESSLNPAGFVQRELEEPGPVRWRLSTRIAFRFCFCYMFFLAVGCIYVFVYYMRFMTGSALWGYLQVDPWRSVVPWIALHIYHIQRSLFIFPESDYLYGYLQHLCELVVALTATVVWSFLDRNRPHYRQLFAWLTLLLRFALAITLLSYGFDKVFPLQFRPVTVERLVAPAGDLNHFGMLWIFMAASKPYTIFSGMLEVIAGILLLLPRLEMLGALFSVAVLSNVVVLNLAYNVQVKLFSAHLLLVAIFLAVPAILMIFRLLVLRQSVPPILVPRLSGRRQVDRGVRIGVSVLAIVFGGFTFAANRSTYLKVQAAATEQQSLPFGGMWEEDRFSVTPVVGGPPVPSLFTEKLQREYQVGPGEDHWHRLFFRAAKRMTIQFNNDHIDTVDLAPDSHPGFTTVTDTDDPAWKAVLSIQQTGKDQLSIQGTVNGAAVSITMHRKDIRDFPLMQDEFHWIMPEPQ